MRVNKLEEQLNDYILYDYLKQHFEVDTSKLINKSDQARYTYLKSWLIFALMTSFRNQDPVLINNLVDGDISNQVSSIKLAHQYADKYCDGLLGWAYLTFHLT